MDFYSQHINKIYRVSNRIYTLTQGIGYCRSNLRPALSGTLEKFECNRRNPHYNKAMAPCCLSKRSERKNHLPLSQDINLASKDAGSVITLRRDRHAEPSARADPRNRLDRQQPRGHCRPGACLRSAYSPMREWPGHRSGDFPLERRSSSSARCGPGWMPIDVSGGIQPPPASVPGRWHYARNLADRGQRLAYPRCGCKAVCRSQLSGSPDRLVEFCYPADWCYLRRRLDRLDI